MVCNIAKLCDYPAGVKSVLRINSGRVDGAPNGSCAALSTELYTRKIFEREYGVTLPLETCMQLESKMTAPPAGPSSTSIPYSSANSLRESLTDPPEPCITKNSLEYSSRVTPAQLRYS